MKKQEGEEKKEKEEKITRASAEQQTCIEHRYGCLGRKEKKKSGGRAFSVSWVYWVPFCAPHLFEDLKCQDLHDTDLELQIIKK